MYQWCKGWGWGEPLEENSGDYLYNLGVKGERFLNKAGKPKNIKIFMTIQIKNLNGKINYRKRIKTQEYKTLLKEIKSLNKWKSISYSWIRTFSIMKMATIYKSICKSNTIPIHVPMGFAEIDSWFQNPYEISRDSFPPPQFWN